MESTFDDSRSEGTSAAPVGDGTEISIETSNASRTVDRREPAPEAERTPGRLKVLISAYSCAPGAGSERGIGWNTARELAKRHDVWVMTRRGAADGQQAAIEEELRAHPIDTLHFLYYDIPEWLRHILGVQVSSYVWQLRAHTVAKRAHREVGFDIGHHVSWVRYYTPSLLAFLDIPFIWGPIGGGDAMPRAYRRVLGFRARVSELQRRVLGFLAGFDPLVRLTARRATIALANSQETAERVGALGVERIRIFGESGVDRWVLDYADEPPPILDGPIRFASLTRLLHWKGVHLGLEAFARLESTDVVYWVVGEGPEEPRLRTLARDLGIADRVEFLPDLSRSEWMNRLRGCDALVHPCIYNSGSAISLEAMAMGRPVICLDRGGIRDQVTNDIGFRVRAEDPEEAIEGLHRSMQVIIDDRDRAAQMGLRARERVLKHFSWPARAAEFDRVYAYALALPSRDVVPASEPHSVTVRKT